MYRSLGRNPQRLTRVVKTRLVDSPSRTPQYDSDLISNLNLIDFFFNTMWQKRPGELDHWLKFEKENWHSKFNRLYSYSKFNNKLQDDRDLLILGRSWHATEEGRKKERQKETRRKKKKCLKVYLELSNTFNKYYSFSTCNTQCLLRCASLTVFV